MRIKISLEEDKYNTFRDEIENTIKRFIYTYGAKIEVIEEEDEDTYDY